MTRPFTNHADEIAAARALHDKPAPLADLRNPPRLPKRALADRVVAALCLILAALVALWVGALITKAIANAAHAAVWADVLIEGARL